MREMWLGFWAGIGLVLCVGMTANAADSKKEGVAAKPGEVQSAQADGSILLFCNSAEPHGAMIRYEPQTNKMTIGYWVKKEDWVSWNFKVPKAGKYKVEILQGCGPKSGGSEVEFKCDDQTLSITVQETKGFQDFLKREIGSFDFKAVGEKTLEVRAKSKPGMAVMDLRQVRLIPE